VTPYNRNPRIKTEPSTRFGKCLRTLRLERQWFLTDVAAASQLSKSYCTQLEIGTKTATREAVIALAQAYDLSIEGIVDLTIAAVSDRVDFFKTGA
jgi:transcriptional regulator with XRE-family HTH domain